MKDLVLHPDTRLHLEAFVSNPSHALMLVAPAGSGKITLAKHLAELILELPENQFHEYPYGLHISSTEGKAIGIEAVRQLEKFLSLKVPGSLRHDRVILIEDAHLLSLEAQNALLKLLEEPPVGTILLLTVSHWQAVLPTIRSRAQTIQLGRLDSEALESYFIQQGYDKTAVKQAYAISAGLPGLMQALLDDEEHPLRHATALARQLLSQPSYERMLMVDELSKQRQAAIDVAFILQQMAHVSLKSASGQSAQRWEAVLNSSYEAAEALLGNAQPKLALTKLMLTL